MTTQTTTLVGTKSSSMILQALLAVVLGGSMLFVAGFAHSATLHDAAHDVRHASGFPCH